MNRKQLLAAARAALANEFGPLAGVSKQCHAASLALVKAGVAKRVARGTCLGVGGQHSWAVVGNDCYDDDAVIIDPTLWSYDPGVKGIWIGTMGGELRHKPHGYGNIWSWGQPKAGDGEPIVLTPKARLSKEAKHFIELLGPLDRHGWQVLATHAPVQGWPAGEILAAIEDTEPLKCVVPIDRIGMLTDRNPGGLYLG